MNVLLLNRQDIMEQLAESRSKFKFSCVITLAFTALLLAFHFFDIYFDQFILSRAEPDILTFDPNDFASKFPNSILSHPTIIPQNPYYIQHHEKAFDDDLDDLREIYDFSPLNSSQNHDPINFMPSSPFIPNSTLFSDDKCFYNQNNGSEFDPNSFSTDIFYSSILHHRSTVIPNTNINLIDSSSDNILVSNNESIVVTKEKH